MSNSLRGVSPGDVCTSPFSSAGFSSRRAVPPKSFGILPPSLLALLVWETWDQPQFDTKHFLLCEVLKNLFKSVKSFFFFNFFRKNVRLKKPSVTSDVSMKQK